MLRRLSGQIDVASHAPPSVSTVAKVFWALALCVLLAVAFLPYRYRAAGTFETLPAQRTVVAVRTSGVVDKSWCAREIGSLPIKCLPSFRPRSSSATLQLRTRNCSVRKRSSPCSAGAQRRLKTDSALEQSLADALGDEADSASRKKDASSANYARTQVERAARAEVERLTRKLAHDRDQLAQTNVRAPKEGRVMTPNVQFLTGTWSASRF